MLIYRRIREKACVILLSVATALLAAAVLSNAASAKGAPPEVDKYGSEVEATPSEAELFAARIIAGNASGDNGHKLEFDPRLLAVCREIAGLIQADFSRQAEFISSPFLSRMMRKYGVYDTALRARTVTFMTMDDLRSTARLHFESVESEVTHMGVGVAPPVSRDKVGVALVILVSRRAVLKPFPKKVALQSTHKIEGTLVNTAVSLTPHVYVTEPSGKVHKMSVSIEKQSFSSNITFDRGPGLYRIEVAAGGKDSMLAALLVVEAGFESKAMSGVFEVSGFKDAPESEAEAERLMVEMINQVRAKEGLMPVVHDHRLAGMAKAHSRDMAENNFFGHLSPENGNVAQRARAHDIDAKVKENLALSTDLAQAFNNLLHSPAHRVVIIDPHMGRVGVGVAFDDSRGTRHYYVTQEFAAY